MKKFKHVLSMILKWILILSPGIITMLILLSAHGWIVSILAALGVLFVIGIIFMVGYFSVAELKAQREINKSITATDQDQKE